jgi:uncharacterized membrane protein YidH (DUF202 family)
VAELVEIDGQQYKRRSPLGAWGLAFLTLGIYAFVYHYKVNDEARRFLGDDTIKPGIAVLAVTLGVLLIVPPYISYYRTGERIRRMEQYVGQANELSPALGLLGAVVMILHIPYFQEHLNRIWQRYAPQHTPLPGAAPLPPA